MSVTPQRLDRERDAKALHRIWREVGWIEEDTHERALDLCRERFNGWVARLAGDAECLVLTSPGSMRYQEADLRLCGIMMVATSRVARRQGLAGRLTAVALAEAAGSGTAVAGLGMFEQGFYDRLGFGSMPYIVGLHFDPAKLRVPARFRPPRRLSADDAALMHANRCARMRVHGSAVFDEPAATESDMRWAKNGFGLGYFEGDRLTHHLFAEAKSENGPYSIWWLAYQTGDQLLELLALIAGLSDQVHLVRLPEPLHLQLQDLLDGPLRSLSATRSAKREQRFDAVSWQQLRILDLPRCIAATRTNRPVRFNLTLSDPVERYLDGAEPVESGWRGIAGEYAVALDEASEVEPGHRAGLPDLRASAGAFSRLWAGVRPASSLALTDDLAGPADLLADLDRAMPPPPQFDWMF